MEVPPKRQERDNQRQRNGKEVPNIGRNQGTDLHQMRLREEKADGKGSIGRGSRNMASTQKKKKKYKGLPEEIPTQYFPIKSEYKKESRERGFRNHMRRRGK